ncbi:hypothetical protein [Paraburkholderia sp. BR14320]|uniref:hypothetical protein n=1 Tax=unclassified Paraburkholderia TaxID=2615204 RepID=UPI0034CE4414
MSTRILIRNSERMGNLPAWRLYSELFEQDDVLYLEISGVKINVTLIADMEAAAGTALIRLPTATAKQLGLVPADWDPPPSFGSN